MPTYRYVMSKKKKKKRREKEGKIKEKGRNEKNCKVTYLIISNRESKLSGTYAPASFKACEYI